MESHHVDIRRGKGFGFISDGKIYLQRCFRCGLENWAPAVASGRCAWCGYVATEKEPIPNGEPEPNEKET